MNQKETSRRHFLKTGVGSVLAGLALPHVFSETVRAQAPGPNSRLGVGIIGCGGRSGAHQGMLQGLKKEGMPIEFVAVCDVYRPHAERAQKRLGAGQLFMDHRELLARKDIDLVCIATPDHHHGYQAIDALQAGKHVYCEKPVTHWRQFDLTRKLADVAAASPCTFQLGTQAMSDGAWHQMKKLVKEGLIGKPLFGETGFFRIGDWGERGMRIDDPNAKPGPDLNWEAFLGDAPKRAFSVDRFFRWRLFEDYAGGPVTDLFPHCLTQVVDILGVGFPDTVVATAGIDRYTYELRDVPDTINLLAQYPEKVTISVLGTQANDFYPTPQRGAGGHCPVIRGWEGSLTIDKNNKEILFTGIRDKDGKADQRFPIEHGEDNTAHWKNLIACAQSGKKDNWSPMELAFRVQTVLQMAALGAKQGKVAHFDAKQRQIVF